MKHIWVFAALLPLVVTGCTAEWIIPEDYYVECESNADCPDSAECMLTDDGTARVCVTDGRAECGNGVQEAGESCDDGNNANGDYCSPNCQEVTSVCGDGKQELAEVCDHNGEIDGWYCNEGCLTVRKECGDGVVAISTDGRDGRDGEVCDEGSSNTNDYQLTQTCLSDCSGYGSYCGDGIQDDAEACDEFGNTENGCTASCQKSPEVECGDLITHSAFEQCDDGLGPDGVPVTEVCDYGEETCLVCDATCQVQTLVGAWCGDGIIQHEGAAVGSFEGCDGDVSCSELGLGTGTALCSDDCMAYNTSGCSNQEMVFVPAGPFLMGCNAVVDFECGSNELPPHEVYLDSFLLDRTEVTAGDYKACVDAGDCTYGGNTDSYHTYNNSRDNHPINYVNHTDAKTYCEAQDKRLPTEAEWEKAARGTDGRKYPWGNSPEVSCTYVVMDEGGDGCGTGQTWEVGSKLLGVSPYGAHDMIGNVREWTADWYDGGYYGQTPAEGWVNPEGPSSGSSRVLRGGSFFNYVTYSFRASNRGFGNPVDRYDGLGFRCAQ